MQDCLKQVQMQGIIVDRQLGGMVREALKQGANAGGDVCAKYFTCRVREALKQGANAGEGFQTGANAG
jgi:hypothetical protein